MTSTSAADTVRNYLRALREPRYAPLTALMVLVALVCIGAGTWQIVRFEDKVRDNDALRANAHAVTAPVRAVLPLVGAPAPSADAVRYRTVTATGHFDAAHTAYVRLRSVNGTDGDLVVTPLVTSAGELLVVRGLDAGPAGGSAPAPPTGEVTITARAQSSEPARDSAAQIARGQLLSINAPAQAAHLHKPVFNGYAALLSGQPGTKGLIAIPAPDLSNPAGGAVEPQHFAYIIQWYLFAMLALAAPFAMVRADRRERGESAVAPSVPTVRTDEERRAAKLADRYGRVTR